MCVQQFSSILGLGTLLYGDREHAFWSCPKVEWGPWEVVSPREWRYERRNGGEGFLCWAGSWREDLSGTSTPPLTLSDSGFADACPQRTLCLLDQLADAGHHGHHGHGDAECGWKHLCEPGGYHSLLPSCSTAASPGRAGVLGPRGSDSVGGRDTRTFSQGHQRPLPRGCSIRGCTLHLSPGLCQGGWPQSGTSHRSGLRRSSSA